MKLALSPCSTLRDKCSGPIQSDRYRSRIKCVESVTTLRCFGYCRLLGSILRDAGQLCYTRQSDKEIDCRQTIVYGSDNKRISHPNETRSRESNVLRNAEFVGWSAEIFYSGSDETPLHERRPEEHCLRTCRVVHESSKPGSSRRYCCARHC